MDTTYNRYNSNAKKEVLSALVPGIAIVILGFLAVFFTTKQEKSDFFSFVTGADTVFAETITDSSDEGGGCSGCCGDGGCGCDCGA